MKNIHYENLYKNEKEHWWYRVRRKIVRDIFERYTDKSKKGLKILDAGCGTGALMNEVCLFGEVYGLDFSVNALNFCKERGEQNLTLGSIDKVPFPDNYFDVVLALDVLEHIKDDNEAILEVKRVLKKDGLAIFFVPANMFLWGITDELSNHFRRYTAPELNKKIIKTGMTIIRKSYFNTFLFLPILLTRTFVRIFGIKIKNENDINSKFMNNIFYWIFYVESLLLKYINLPFGVSIMVISKK